MKKRFRGNIDIDIRSSTPDWAPFMPRSAKAGAPNVHYVVWDDTGTGAWDVYGGVIRIPGGALRRLVCGSACSCGRCRTGKVVASGADERGSPRGAGTASSVHAESD